MRIVGGALRSAFLILPLLLVPVFLLYPVCVDAETGLIKCVVVDENDQPVEGARVTAVRLPDREPANPFSPDLDVLTDEQGRFEVNLPVGKYISCTTKELLTSADAPWPSQEWHIKASPDPQEVRIPLKMGGRVKGVVIDKETGEPIPGATVMTVRGRTATTDNEGSFDILGESAKSGTLTVLAAGYGDVRKQYYMPNSGAYEIRLELSPGYIVRGRVVDEEGSPVAGAIVDCGSSYINFKRRISDDQGRFEVAGCSAGKSFWQISHPDYALNSNPELSFPETGDVVETDFVLTKGWAVAGRVVGPDGNPIKDARVDYGFSNCYVYRASTRTDATGAFRLEKIGTDSEDFIIVRANGCATAYQRAKPGRAESVPKLEFALEPGRYAKGAVKDRAGQPVSGANVWVYLLLQGSNFCSPPEWEIQSHKADAEGRFQLSDLPSKDVTVRVQKEGYSIVDNYPVKPDAEMVVVMDKPEVIAGRVLDAATGLPVRTFNIKLDFSAQGGTPGLGLIHSAGKDFDSSDGEFELTGLAARSRYALIVSAEGFAPKRIDPVETWPADEEGMAIVASLDAGLTISGEILDAAAGQPLPDAEVFLIISPRKIDSSLRVESLDDSSGYIYDVRKGQSDAKGHFEFKHVGEDHHLMLAARGKHHALAIIKQVDPEAQQILRLARGGRIAGTAKGFPDIKVDKASIALSGDFELPRVKLTDDFGFEVENVPPGEYSVCLRQESSGIRNVRVKVEPGKDVFIDYANIPGKRVSGRVSCAGKPLTGLGVRMNWSLSGDWVVGGKTDDDGRFSYPGISPGEYVFTVDLTDVREQPYNRSTRHVIVEERDVNLDIEIQPNIIKGRVVDGATGKPIPDVFVSALRLQQPGGQPNRLVTLRPEHGYIVPHGSASNVIGMRLTRPIKTDSEDRGSYGVTAEDGSFEIKHVEPGHYRLSVHMPGCTVRQLSDKFMVKPAQETTRKDIRVDSDATLRLKIIDASTGSPIPEALINLCATDGMHIASGYYVKVDEEDRQVATCGISGCAPGGFEYRRMTTDAQGLLTVPGVQEDEYGVWIIAPGYSACWIAPVQAEVGEGKEFVIKLEPTGSVLLKPTAGLLDGIDLPYLVYRILDSKGRTVFPGGELIYQELVESGVAKLYGEGFDSYKLDVVPPGQYSIEWEIHRGYLGDPIPRPVYSPSVYGKSRFEIRRGAEAVVQLVAGK